MNIMNTKFITLVCRYFLGIIFIYASFSKIIDPISFSSNIDNYHITPIAINNLVALIIPWIELFIGLGLIFNKYIKGSIVIMIFLLILFIIMISQAYFRGIDLHCGCFKSIQSSNIKDLKADMLKKIAEDIVFLCMAIYLYFIYIIKPNNYDQ